MVRPDPGSLLRNLTAKPALHSLGLMTGTSMDGLDLALVTVSGDRILHGETEWVGFIPFPEGLRREIGHGLHGPTAAVADVNYSLGRWMSEAAKGAMEYAYLPNPDCIGCHGQTLFHRSGRATLQVGEPAFLAQTFQAPVVSNFRAKD
ncbi:MAG: anhydro-N-acetylmuramic acid kinase, partial [Fidelibacterota bacterium]